MIKKRNKRAGFEMSMTTIVILVIAVAMLMLGIYFINRIRTTASESLDVMDSQVRDQLTKMFASGAEGRTVAILQSTVKVKPGTMSFSVPIAFDSKTSSYEDLKYNVAVMGVGTCATEMDVDVADWIFYPKRLNQWDSNFTRGEGSTAYLNIQFNIPDDAPECNEMIKVACQAKQKDGTWKAAGFDTFTIEVASGGLFG